MEGTGSLNIADFARMIDDAIKRIINHLGDIPFIGVPSNPVDFDLMEENIHIIETATTGMRVVIRGMKLSQGLASPGEEGPANDLEEIIAFLLQIKEHGSIGLQTDIDLVIAGINHSMLLEGLGIYRE